MAGECTQESCHTRVMGGGEAGEDLLGDGVLDASEWEAIKYNIEKRGVSLFEIEMLRRFITIAKGFEALDTTVNVVRMMHKKSDNLDSTGWMKDDPGRGLPIQHSIKRSISLVQQQKRAQDQKEQPGVSSTDPSYPASPSDNVSSALYVIDL